jgi:hypothetical protein
MRGHFFAWLLRLLQTAAGMLHSGAPEAAATHCSASAGEVLNLAAAFGRVMCAAALPASTANMVGVCVVRVGSFVLRSYRRFRSSVQNTPQQAPCGPANDWESAAAQAATALSGKSCSRACEALRWQASCAARTAAQQRVVSYVFFLLCLSCSQRAAWLRTVALRVVSWTLVVHAAAVLLRWLDGVLP